MYHITEDVNTREQERLDAGYTGTSATLKLFEMLFAAGRKYFYVTSECNTHLE